MRRYIPLTIILAIALAGCHHRAAKPRPKVSPSASAPVSPVRVAIVVEDGDLALQSARELATLITHFDERSEIIPAGKYAAGKVADYKCTFYLAGSAKSPARETFAADLAKYQGIAIWVGPGVSALGQSALKQLALRPGGDTPDEARPWQLRYGSQGHLESLPIPPVDYDEKRPSALAVVGAPDTFSGRRPFLSGSGRLWYAAAGPLRGEEHFWSRCVWADGLHEIMGVSHTRQRLLVPVLRDVPVWVSDQQVLTVIRPLLNSHVPVSVMAQTRTGGGLRSDRP